MPKEKKRLWLAREKGCRYQNWYYLTSSEPKPMGIYGDFGDNERRDKRNGYSFSNLVTGFCPSQFEKKTPERLHLEPGEFVELRIAVVGPKYTYE